MPVIPISQTTHDELNLLGQWVQDLRDQGVHVRSLCLPYRLRQAWGNGLGVMLFQDIPVRFKEPR